MAWGLTTIFGSSPSEPTPVRQKSSDGGYVAPDRNTREVCYESRDLFFECLDKNDILDAVRNDEDAKKKCGKEMGEFERDCARSWIKYFKEKRVMEHNRDMTLAKIQQDDAEAAAKSKARRQTGGGKGWFS